MRQLSVWLNPIPPNIQLTEATKCTALNGAEGLVLVGWQSASSCLTPSCHHLAERWAGTPPPPRLAGWGRGRGGLGRLLTGLPSVHWKTSSRFLMPPSKDH